jgi:diguanylate cyclase (GGDEF)-like protein
MTTKKSPSSNQKYVLPLGFTLIILLMMGNVIYTVTQMKKSSDVMYETFNHQNVNNTLLRIMSQTALNRSTILVEMIHENDPFVIDELFLKFNELGATFAVARENFTNQDYLDKTLITLLDKQGDLSKVNVPKQIEIYELIAAGKKDKAMSLFADDMLHRQQEIFDILKAMEKHQTASINNFLLKSKSNYDDSLFSIMIFDTSTIFISIFLAIYLLRKQVLNDRKLAKLATTDILTKLPNRFNFTNCIDELISAKPSSTFAIIFFDIDYFKSINDNYGHEMGDEILKKYVHKLKSVINKTDILSRFGGDEFVLLLRNIDSKKEAEIFISELSKKLDASCVIDNNEIFLTSSIGVSVYSIDASDAKTLLKHADIAMYTAKESGRNCYQFFSLETQSKMEREHTISHALQTVIKNGNCDNELYLKYQPLLSIANNEINECEALIRWKTKDGAHIPTDEFITIAEKSNLIEKINLFVIEEACKQQKIWQKSGINNTRININLSGNKLIFANLLIQFNRIIKALDLSPSLFGIELTERTLLDVSDETIQSLKKCRDSGMKISIDDFGTGYSSLSYLKKLPITTIKIDKSFIAGLPDDKDDCELVKTIITLGHSLKLDIVAEGVETLEQLEFLKSHSCDILQGYYLHRPLEHKQITKLKLVA